jgi:hypothetical protein
VSNKKQQEECYCFEECTVGDIHGKAVRVSKGGVYWYIPLSQVKILSPCKTRITVTAWIAKKSGWI